MAVSRVNGGTGGRTDIRLLQPKHSNRDTNTSSLGTGKGCDHNRDPPEASIATGL